MAPLPKDLADQFAQAQQSLVGFLRADLELAFTMLRTAEIEHAAKNLEHMRASVAKVQEALSSVRRLAGRVEDHETSSEIAARANELETALAIFQKQAI